MLGAEAWRLLTQKSVRSSNRFNSARADSPDTLHLEIVRGVGRIAGEHLFVSPEELHPLSIGHGLGLRSDCTVTIQGCCECSCLCAANMIFTLCEGLHQHAASLAGDLRTAGAALAGAFTIRLLAFDFLDQSTQAP